VEPSVEQYSRVYRASAMVRDADGRRRLTLGRQMSPSLSPVSLFDGALAEWSGARYGFGLFGGTQPDPIRYGWSGDVVEAGGFAEIHQAPFAAERWSLSAGAVSSSHGGEPNRDFMFLQGWWASRSATASLIQEVDLNRGWKRSAGEPPITWTNTFATLRVPFGRRAVLHTGYDNRRNVRLWRDRETPETEFDDRHRQGAWAGASMSWTERINSGVEYRAGSDEQRSDTWSLTGELRRITRGHGLVRGRWSSFTSALTASTLWSVSTGFDPGARSHMECSFGLRGTRDRLSGFETEDRWAGVDLDLAIGRRLYANGSLEHLSGAGGVTRQVQVGLSVSL
jgi:hypothetical protein